MNMIRFPEDKESLPLYIWLNNRGQLVIDSQVKGWNDIIPFIEDNICDSPKEQGEEIWWFQVFSDYEQWILKDDDKGDE